MIVEKSFEILFSSIAEKYIVKMLPELKLNFPQKTDSKLDDLKYLKLRLIYVVARLGEIPDFNIANATMNKNLTDSFYITAIKVLKELNLSLEHFNYIRNNFSANSVENVEQLIGYLKNESENPKQNDSRYYTGFRSIYFLLKENIDTIDVDYIDSIFILLKPFIENYKNKELLTIMN